MKLMLLFLDTSSRMLKNKLSFGREYQDLVLFVVFFNQCIRTFYKQPLISPSNLNLQHASHT